MNGSAVGRDAELPLRITMATTTVMWWDKERV